MDAAPPSPPAASLAFLGQLVFIAVAAIGSYSFVRVAQEAETHRVCGAPCAMHADYLGADKRAPSFKLRDWNGRSVSLEDFRGKTVVLNFWSRTCRPCLEEMPDLAELQEQLKTRKDVVLLTMTAEDGPEDVIPTLRQVFRDGQVPFPVLFDPEAAIIQGKFGTHLFPETWIIDPAGIIRARFDGTREWTSGVVTEFINEMANGDYCPITVDKSRITHGASCESLAGS